MDTLEQDPEEIPMEQVLAEIRQMLGTTDSPSTNIKNTVQNRIDMPLASEKSVIGAPSQPTAPSIPDRNKSLESVSGPLNSVVSNSTMVSQSTEDYFLLTPAMRCDLPTDSELSQSVQKQTARVLNKLQQQSVTDLSPALLEWLNANLPAMIEKVVSQKTGNNN